MYHGAARGGGGESLEVSLPSHRNEKCESYAETGKAAVSEDNLKQA